MRNILPEGMFIPYFVQTNFLFDILFLFTPRYLSLSRSRYYSRVRPRRSSRYSPPSSLVRLTQNLQHTLSTCLTVDAPSTEISKMTTCVLKHPVSFSGNALQSDSHSIGRPRSGRRRFVQEVYSAVSLVVVIINAQALD